MERVAALVRQVAFLPLGAGAAAPAGGRAVAHPDLTKLLVDLETLHAQLLHLLKGRKGGERVSRCRYAHD